MKVVLLFSLLIYQLLQYCNATDFCRPLSQLKGASIRDLTATIHRHTGSNTSVYYSLTNDCDDSSNTFVLAHLNHHTGELDIKLHQQNDPKFTISLQLSTSGVYCMFKQCATTQERQQCCVRILVSIPEMEMILPGQVENNAIQERGVCFAKTWPLLTANDMDIFTNDTENCTITNFPLRPIDVYTTAKFFNITLNNSNSPCLITCSISLNQKRIVIRIDPTTNISGTTFRDDHSPTFSTGSTLSTALHPMPSTVLSSIAISPTCTCSGALGLYRITLWIIVLTLMMLSTATTSLTSGIL